MKLFISWSGEASYRVAQALREWIPLVINSADPFLASDDIHKGEMWFQETLRAVREADFCVICLTPDNVGSPWLYFEAGLIASRFDMSRTSVFLSGLEPSDVRVPLSIFRVTSPKRLDILALLMEINRYADPPLDPALLSRAFDTWWDELKAELDRAAEGRDDPTLDLVIEPGDATPEEIGELLAEVSTLYRMAGGSGLTFRPKGITSHNVVGAPGVRS